MIHRKNDPSRMGWIGGRGRLQLLRRETYRAPVRGASGNRRPARQPGGMDGATSTTESGLVEIIKRVLGLDNHAQLLARILELYRQKRTSAQIADQLNREGFRPPKRRETFNRQMVRTLLSRQVRAEPCARAVENHTLAIDQWWFTDLARELNMPQPTLYHWLRRGWVNARQLPVAGGRWIIWADAEELDRLRRLHRCPRRWHNQPQAATLTRPKRRPEAS